MRTILPPGTLARAEGFMATPWIRTDSGAGVTVTDTAFLRDRHDHTPHGTPDKLTSPEMTTFIETLIGMPCGLDQTLPVR